MEIVLERKMPWISGRGTAVRFGAASCAALVVEFCWQGQGGFLSEKCPSRFVFEILHLPGELPAGKAFENSEASFRKPFAEGGCVDSVTLE